MKSPEELIESMLSGLQLGSLDGLIEEAYQEASGYNDPDFMPSTKDIIAAVKVVEYARKFSRKKKAYDTVSQELKYGI